MHILKTAAKGIILLFLILGCMSQVYSQTSNCLDYQERMLTDFFSPDLIFLGKGDYNGDGLDDLISNKSSTEFNVHFGTTQFENLVVNQTITFSQLISPGDINDDNYDDVVVIENRSLKFYYGSSQGLQLQSNLTINYPDSYVVILSGGDDFNHDGLADFIVNTKADIDPQNGTVYVYHGSANGPALLYTTTGNDLNVDLYPVKYIGDLNNDNYPDISDINTSSQTVYYGTNGGFDTSHKITLPILAELIYPGGDFNGDGFDDLLVINQQLDINIPSATIYLGSPTGISSSPSYSYVNPRYNLEDEYKYGFNGGPLGDINDDGLDDFYISGGSNDYTEVFLGNNNVSSIRPFYRIKQLTSSLISIDYKNDNDLDLIGAFVGGLPSEIYMGLIESNNNEYASTSCPAFENAKNVYFGDRAMAAGDMNRDGYDDFVVTIFDIDPDMGSDGTGYVISGGANGPGKLLLDLGYYKSMGEQMSNGDLNGDGYGDIYFGSELHRNQNKDYTGIVFAHFGQENGPDSQIDFQVFGANEGTYLGGRVARGGDINGDGYDDILTQSIEGVLLYYGKPGGPDNIPSWTNNEYNGVTGVGDINNDGFSDFFAEKGQNNTLFYGSSNGPTISNYTVASSIKYIGDINNDGYDDAQLQEYIYPYNPIKILLGSPSGYIDPNQLTDKIFFPAGDFNGDGIDDVMATVYYQDGPISRSRVDLFYGSQMGLKDSSDHTFYPAGSTENLYAVATIGDINKDGKDDLALRQGNTNMLIYLGRGDELDSCANDSMRPVISLPADQVKCSGAGQVTVPLLEATDNCTVKSISYVITGATSRTGTGNDASGHFNKGISTITWSVADLAGNIATAVQQVKVEQQLHASIPKAYQINATQSAPYTIYLGYANNTIRLVAWESRTKGPYRYKWSNGDTARYTRVRHNIPGNYNYSVIISNEFGCSDTAYTTIKVIDNYCPNPLKDFISQYFPQYLNDPFVQSLLMATSQSYICVNGNTQCVPTGSLKNYINSGAKLGKCGSIPNAANLKTAEELSISDVLNITASPNPSSYEFNLKISGMKGKPYSLRIYNNNGALVMQKHNLTQEFIRTGSTLQKGIYVAEVIQGNQRKSIRLLKIK